MAGCGNSRLKQVLGSLVRHLHDVAREVKLTEAEWMAGIDFLTATGQLRNDKRQEFILLSAGASAPSGARRAARRCRGLYALSHGAAGGLSRAQRWTGRKDAACHRQGPLAPRAHSLHGGGHGMAIPTWIRLSPAVSAHR